MDTAQRAGTGAAPDLVLTLMLQRAAPARPPTRIDIHQGESLTMGSCPCDDCGTDLVLTCRPGAWVRCVVTAHGDHWRLDNLCTDVEGIVVDQENTALQVHAGPGRRQLVVPFEFSEVWFRLGPCQVSERITVIGPEVLVESGVACPSSVAPLAGAGLRHGTHYAAVLEELCRSTADGGEPPTSAEVAELLDQRGLHVTPKAVDHHVDYLFRRLYPSQSETEGRGYKRWALASLMHRRSIAHHVIDG